MAFRKDFNGAAIDESVWTVGTGLNKKLILTFYSNIKNNSPYALGSLEAEVACRYLINRIQFTPHNIKL